MRFLSQGFLPQEGLELPPEEEAPGQVIGQFVSDSTELVTDQGCWVSGCRKHLGTGLIDFGTFDMDLPLDYDVLIS